MQAIEFETKIKDGIIVLPPKYHNLTSKRTRIIVLVSDDNTITEQSQKKEKLRLAFRKLQEVNPFREINNPVEWQKQLRDEWERSTIG